MQANSLGSPSPSALASHEDLGKTMTNAEAEAIRHAYVDAFGQDMKISAMIAAVSVLLTLLAYRQSRLTLSERRKRQIEEEISRQRVGADAVLT